MKIKKVARLIKAERFLALYNIPDENGVPRQWIGTDAAAFPLDGLPVLDIDQVLQILDIDEKTAEKLHIDENAEPWFDGGDVRVSDLDAVASDVSVEIPGVGTAVLVGSGTTWRLVRWDDVAAADRPDRLQIRFPLLNNNPQILATRGLFTVGVFRPLDKVAENVERELQAIAEAVRRHG